MYNCEKCGYSTTFKQRYQVHLLSKRHTEEKEKIELYECKKCNYSTTCKQRYQVHLLSKKHVEDEYIDKIRECKCCRFKCITLQQFNRHKESKKHKSLYTLYPLIQRLEQMPIHELDDIQRETIEKFYNR